MKDSSIRAVSGTALELPFFDWRQGGFSWDGKDQDQKLNVSYNTVDHNVKKS